MKNNKLYSKKYLENLSREELLSLMEEHGYKEGYQDYNNRELIEQLSTI